MGERERSSMLEQPRSMLEVAPKSIFDGYQNPSALLETPRTGGGINHNFGDVSVHPPPAAAQAKSKFVEAPKSSLDWMSQTADLGESLSNGLKNVGAEKAFGSTGDLLNTYKGGTEIYGGVESIIQNGLTKDNALDTGKGILDTITGVAGFFGDSRVKGNTGIASGAVDILRGLGNAFWKDDLNEATAGANQAVEGFGSTISSYGDKTGNPLLMGAGRALNIGMAGGKFLRGGADSIDMDSGYYHDDSGNVQTGSSEAADWGRSVDGFFGHSSWDNSKLGWAADKFGGFAGGVTAVAGGIGNTAYTYGHRATDAIGDAGSAVGGAVSDAAGAAKDFLFGGPSIMDIARAQIERQLLERQ